MSSSDPVRFDSVPIPGEDYTDFLEAYRRKLRNLFGDRANIDLLSLKRGMPPFVMREIWERRPLSVVVPQEYGGRGQRIHEFLGVLAASSYESLALSLMMGINGGLFLQPVGKYGNEQIKGPIFSRFLQNDCMGGMMITEPMHGSDALRIETCYEEHPDHFRIRGTKHWAGLTGVADFWLVAARKRETSGQLGRDVDFFVIDLSSPNQRIEVEEQFENLGLYMIPYGRNRVDAVVPHLQRLEPESTGVRMMLDMLYRSRLQFAGMGMGFLKRMLDEALAHCKERHVGGKSLFCYDQVRARLARLQASYTACSAMCAYTSEHAGVDRNLSSDGLPANSIKAVLTDLMHDASESLLQLIGAKGYRLDHVAGRSTVDSRPFQIFEGSNDILYQQVSESVLKRMRKLKEANLYRYLKESDLTSRAADYFRGALSFDVSLDMPQRKLVDLGRMLSRVVSMEMTIELGERGFRSDLISNCLSEMKQDVEGALASYGSDLTHVVDDYVVGSSWLSYIQTQDG
jgi:alkylation response protein AidB-like acyl-CoA dehydrogenase